MPEPVWTVRRGENPAPGGTRTPTHQSFSPWVRISCSKLLPLQFCTASNDYVLRQRSAQEYAASMGIFLKF
jgi:hypothetical protein